TFRIADFGDEVVAEFKIGETVYAIGVRFGGTTDRGASIREAVEGYLDAAQTVLGRKIPPPLADLIVPHVADDVLRIERIGAVEATVPKIERDINIPACYGHGVPAGVCGIQLNPFG